MNHYESGIYDISINEYHESEGISRSGIMLYKKSPLHYWNQYENPNRNINKDETPQQLLGSAVHTMLLEPRLFDEQYFIEEKIDRRTKEGKARWDLIQIEHAGKKMITQDVYDKISRIQDSFLNNEYAKHFVQGAKIEKSIFWNDCATNVLCKARPDIWHNNMICDIKTTQDASIQSFQRSIANYGYHIQASMIVDGIHHVQNYKIENYIFIVIETIEPYAIAIYFLDKESIEKGHKEYKEIIKDYSKCMEKEIKIWPGYKPTTVSLPAYYI